MSFWETGYIYFAAAIASLLACLPDFEVVGAAAAMSITSSSKQAFLVHRLYTLLCLQTDCGNVAPEGDDGVCERGGVGGHHFGFQTGPLCCCFMLESP